MLLWRVPSHTGRHIYSCAIWFCILLIFNRYTPTMQCSSLLAVYSNYSSINHPAKAKSSSVCELIWRGGREGVGVEISGVQGWGGGIIVGRCQITWTAAAVHILSAAKPASESKKRNAVTSEARRCDPRGVGDIVGHVAGHLQRQECRASWPPSL